MLKKKVVVFGATGSQGGAIARYLLKSNERFAVKAVTRNPDSNAAKKLQSAGADLVQADMDDIASLEMAMKGAHVIFAVTDFFGSQDAQLEAQQGKNMVDAAVKSALGTLECYLWSGLPDPRIQPYPFYHIYHFNSKCEVSKYIRTSPLSNIFTEVWISAYYQNYVKLHETYGPQKKSTGSYVLIYPVDADSKMPFTSVEDLGRLGERIISDPSRYRKQVISMISQAITPIDQLRIWKEVVGVEASFKSVSTEEYRDRLVTVYKFTDKVALQMAENMSVYKYDPRMWIDNSDVAASDILDNLTDWATYVKSEDWSEFKV